MAVVDLSKISERLFKDHQEKEAVIEYAKQVASSLQSQNIDAATEAAIKLLETVWIHFSVKKYTEVFAEFAKAQKALYGPELTVIQNMKYSWK